MDNITIYLNVKYLVGCGFWGLCQGEKLENLWFFVSGCGKFVVTTGFLIMSNRQLTVTLEFNNKDKVENIHLRGISTEIIFKAMRKSQCNYKGETVQKRLKGHQCLHSWEKP